MIKGCQKKMIVLRGDRSRYFTEAFFVLRDDCPSPPSEADMVSEANRIVEECLRGGPARPTRRRLSHRASQVVCFLSGALAAGALSLVTFLIF